VDSGSGVRGAGTTYMCAVDHDASYNFNADRLQLQLYRLEHHQRDHDSLAEGPGCTTTLWTYERKCTTVRN
jgi:hypothetical protein